MLKKTLAGIGIGLFSLATALPIDAQDVATLALRNGERPSGELIDMNASGFTLRVNGQDRQFPASEVASVEFVVGPLPADAQAKVNSGQPVVLLRSGQVIDGRLSDIGGARPLRLTVDTPSGQREFTSNDVAQLHLGPLSRAVAGQAATATTGAIPAGTVAVVANRAWTDTGITVSRGARVQFAASGDIMLSSAASSGPNGSPAATVPGIRYPLPSAPAGALIGRIGTGTPFLIGTSTQPIQMPNSGRLMLGVNDDHLEDNSGDYSVAVTQLGR